MQIVPTNDASHSLKSAVWGDLYHSIHGAIQESQHVFIDQGLLRGAQKKKHLRIFEMGFGTGLNAFMTCVHAKNQKLHVQYDCVESHPIGESTWQNLNYPSFFPTADQHFFEQIHQANWEKRVSIHEDFRLTKYRTRLQDFHAELPYSIIYFDAFAPNTQSELWEVDIFKKMYDMLEEDGFLVTYCAKGYVKRNMKSAGFKVVPLPGPPGKREMTMAVKPGQ